MNPDDATTASLKSLKYKQPPNEVDGDDLILLSWKEILELLWKYDEGEWEIPEYRPAQPGDLGMARWADDLEEVLDEWIHEQSDLWAEVPGRAGYTTACFKRGTSEVLTRALTELEHKCVDFRQAAWQPTGRIIHLLREDNDLYIVHKAEGLTTILSEADPEHIP